MNLKNYIIPLFKYWWLILTAVVIAVISSYLVARQQPPIYQTQTTLIVGRAMYETNPTGNDFYLGQQLANYYAEIGMRGEVRNATQEALGLSWLPQYSIYPLPNSQLMEIVVVDSNPARAQAVANELANQLILRSPTSNKQIGAERQEFIDEQVSYLEGKIRETLDQIEEAESNLTEMNSARQIAAAQEEISTLQTKLAQLQNNYTSLISNTNQGAVNSLSVIERAPLPEWPIGPNKRLIIVMAALVAVVIAAAAAYLLEFLDDTIKTSDDVNRFLGIPVLANIPMIIKGIEATMPENVSLVHTLFGRIRSLVPNQKKINGLNGLDETSDTAFIYTSKYPRSEIAEEFRSLRINLDFAGVDKPLKTILITSPSPAEGKTSVATNLAIVMAQGGKRVALLDADFRKPNIDLHFHLPNKKGLSDLFRDNPELNEVLQPWKDTLLQIVTTGITPPNPVDLLSSMRMDQILNQLLMFSDVVIVDGPPLIFPDSLALSTKVDGVLMVLRHSYSRRGTAQNKFKQLARVGAHILGVVLNKTPGNHTNYYSKRNYYKQHIQDSELEPKQAS